VWLDIGGITVIRRGMIRYQGWFVAPDNRLVLISISRTNLQVLQLVRRLFLLAYKAIRLATTSGVHTCTSLALNGRSGT
jgi:hypothetical protein